MSCNRISLDLSSNLLKTFFLFFKVEGRGTSKLLWNWAKERETLWRWQNSSNRDRSQGRNIYWRARQALGYMQHSLGSLCRWLWQGWKAHLWSSEGPNLSSVPVSLYWNNYLGILYVWISCLCHMLGKIDLKTRMRLRNLLLLTCLAWSLGNLKLPCSWCFP